MSSLSSDGVEEKGQVGPNEMKEEPDLEAQTRDLEEALEALDLEAQTQDLESQGDLESASTVARLSLALDSFPERGDENDELSRTAPLRILSADSTSSARTFLPPPRRGSVEPATSEPGARTKSLDVIEAARAAANQVPGKVSLELEWKRRVEIMQLEEACNNTACRVCRWPRSSYIPVSRWTGEVECKAMQRKFHEHVSLSHFRSTLYHLTILMTGIQMATTGVSFYSITHNASLWRWRERNFTHYQPPLRG